MELTPEDQLKLNVLLANTRAIRIDERTMCVYGMTDSGDAKVELHPVRRPDRYLRLVRETLSTQVLGSPKGYPVHLRRWTRMGETQNTRLESLLMLAEDEAVIAAARAPAVTNDLAERIWWALPTAEIARYMLGRLAVVHGTMGPVLADHLAEHLPFEEDPGTAIETVRLILQPGLIDDGRRLQVWRRGAHKNHYYVGFLQAVPDDLPDSCPARADYPELAAALQPLAGNPYVAQMLRVLSGTGQTFLTTCEQVLRKPADQEVVVALLDTMYDYFRDVRHQPSEFNDLGTLHRHVGAWLDNGQPMLAELRRIGVDLEPELHAMLLLAHIGEPMVRPIFARTDAVGSVMRNKISPVTTTVLEAFATLRRSRTTWSPANRS